MDLPKTKRCPDCRYLFIGPVPHFCPRCHACLHGSTLGTETRSITVTYHSQTPPPPEEPLPRILDSDEPRTSPPRVKSPSPESESPKPVHASFEKACAPSPIQTDPPPAPRRKPAPKGRLASVRSGFRQSPWALLSLGIHMLLFLFLAQLVFLMRELPDYRIVELSLIDSEGLEEGPGDGEDDRDEDPLPEEPEAPPETPAEAPPQETVEEPRETVDPSPAPPREEDDANVGPGTGEESGEEGAGELRNRTGAGRGDALRRFGGNSRSERAVRMGLSWLVRHQHARGYWSGATYNEHCEGEPCTGEGTAGYEVGHTGLALLCFLGSGHTHRFENLYRGTVNDGLRWLLSLQGPDGLFGPPSNCYMYNHSIALLAVSEAWAMTRDPALREPVERAVRYLETAQQKSGGWDYIAFATGRNDVSVTGWVVMALQSAGAGGIPVPALTWRKARHFLLKMTQGDGQVEYEDRGFRGRQRWSRRGPGMAAVALVCHQYFGDGPDTPRLRKIAERLRAHPPSLKALLHEKLHTNYYWYYATLGFFQMGGEHWRWWNGLFRDFVIALQTQEGCAAGSWDPVDGWMGPYGGRLYATTLNLLCLEIYYRYLPLYQSRSEIHLREKDTQEEHDVDAETSIKFARDLKLSSGRRLKAIQALESVSGEAARQALESLLSDENPVICWGALKALGNKQDPASVPALLQALNQTERDLIPSFLKALGRIGTRRALEAILPHLSSPEARIRTASQAALETATGKRVDPVREKWARVIDEMDED